MHLQYIFIIGKHWAGNIWWETGPPPTFNAFSSINVYKIPRALQMGLNSNKRDGANSKELHCCSYLEKSSQILFDNNSSLYHTADSAHFARYFLNW